MAIDWGSAEKNLRLGIDLDVVSVSATSVTVKFRFYAEPSPSDWSWNDDMALKISGSGGSQTVNFHKNSSQQLVATRTLSASRRAGGGPTWTVECTVSGAHNGATPTARRSYTVPAKGTDKPKPPALASILFSDITQTGATFQWGSSTDDGGSTVFEYQAQVASSPGFPGENIVYDTTGDSKKRTTTALTANTTYYLRVRCRNYAEGFGDWSANRSFTTDPRVPFIVPRNSPSEVTSTSARLTWDPSPNDGGRPVLDYLLRWRPLDTGAWTEITSDDRDHVVTGLTPGVTYEWRVRARNSVGLSAFQDPGLNWTTSVSVPSAPETPVVSLIGTTSATVTWSTPADNGTPITGYEVQRSTTSSFSGASTHPTGVVNSLGLSGLAVDTQYYVRVRATTGSGPGAWSPSRSFSTSAIPVPFPVIRLWNGTGWTRLDPLSIWDGADFLEISDVRYWNGSAFVSILDLPY